MTTKICSVEGCERKVHKKGMCASHYAKWWQAQPATDENRCKQDGCDKRRYAEGYCRRHARWRMESKTFSRLQERVCRGCGIKLPLDARIDTEFCSLPCKMKWHRKEGSYTKAAILESRGSCGYPGCDEPLHTKDLCRKHQMYVWRHNDVDHKPEIREIVECTIEGCKKLGGWKGLCKKHYHAMYLIENRDVIYATVNARRNKQRSAQPPWIDDKAIKHIYRQARSISKETGIKHHVDHVIPLKGRNVCGLHVPWNMQIIPAIDNRKKSANSHEVEPIICKEPECNGTAKYKGWCNKHYNLWYYWNVAKPRREARLKHS